MVGLVLLVVIIAAIVSPGFDLHPTALRKSHRVIAHFGLAVPTFLLQTPPVSLIFLAQHAQKLHQSTDIVARDCARLC
jgi:hypothetical protein